MTLENELIQKKFYKTFVKTGESNPIAVLGEAFVAACEEGTADMSAIRFAQGELYFHYKDYEAAIFKWENVRNELEPWAKKNIADCYYELGQWSMAEEIYKSIAADSGALQSEIALQLFSLYVQEGQINKADQVIKTAVSFHPDYRGVTEMARAFFEKHQDWPSAIELAVNEAVRTSSHHWFDVLTSYAEQGVINSFEPAYFSKCLAALHELDEGRFEKLVHALWNSYRHGRLYFSWLKEFNALFCSFEESRKRSWKMLSALYRDTYLELMDGTYFIQELETLMPNLLANWSKVADHSEALFVSAAVLAWNDQFPSRISPEAVDQAEKMLLHARRDVDGLECGLTLFDSLVKWAEEQHIASSHRFKWMVRELIDFQTYHLLVAGTSGNGKSSFVNSILGETVLTAPTSSVIAFKGSDETDIRKISDAEITAFAGRDEFQEAIDRRRHKEFDRAIVEFSLPAPMLQDHQVTLIDLPSFHERPRLLEEEMDYIRFADSLLFVLDANDPLTEQEEGLLRQIKAEVPELPVHFLLNKMDDIYDVQEAAMVMEHTLARVRGYFPEAQLFAYSIYFKNKKQQHDVAEFFKTLRGHISEAERVQKIFSVVRRFIAYLLEQRAEMENKLADSIQWNQEMMVKLNGALHQVTDLKQEKVRKITRAFRHVLDTIRSDLSENIPAILRGSADIIQEDSDFRTLHLALNDEMNRRVSEYVHEKVLPKLYLSLQEWIAAATEELHASQSFLDEMSDGFNALFGEERIQLDCDFKVLDDWRRDADRMTSGVQLDKINIFLRRTPYQMLLKGAGRLLGAFQQHNAILYHKYKQFVETEEYTDVAETIANKMLLQLELFEKSLERDVSIFLRNVFALLNETVEQLQKEANEKEAELEAMRSRPEAYRDPLRLFEIKLRQYEWMTVSASEVLQP